MNDDIDGVWKQKLGNKINNRKETDRQYFDEKYFGQTKKTGGLI